MRYFSICLCVTMTSGATPMGDMLIASDGKYPSMVKVKEQAARQINSKENPVLNIAVVSIIEISEKDFNDYTTHMPPMPNPGTSDVFIHFSQN